MALCTALWHRTGVGRSGRWKEREREEKKEGMDCKEKEAVRRRISEVWRRRYIDSPVKTGGRGSGRKGERRRERKRREIKNTIDRKGKARDKSKRERDRSKKREREREE